jgi:hypothetical protein
MGLFSFVKKAVKGVGKIFKKIGKGIKKIAIKVGTTINKMGIVGQIGLAILMPYAMGALGSVLGKAGAWVANSALGSAVAGSQIGGAVISATSKVVSLASQFGSKVGALSSSVTKGVSSFVGEVATAAANKLGLGNIIPKLGDATFKSAFENLVTNATDVGAKGLDIFSPSSYSWGNKAASKAALTLSSADVGKTATSWSADNAVEKASTSLLAPAKTAVAETVKDAVVDTVKEEAKDSLLTSIVKDTKKTITNEVRGQAQDFVKSKFSSAKPQEDEDYYPNFENEFASQFANLENSGVNPMNYGGMAAQDYMSSNALQYANANPIGGGAQVYNLYQSKLAQFSQGAYS